MRVFKSELWWDHLIASRLMPPTPIESVRRWFLALPQLRKTLVFGGLGMLSGWATTGAVGVWSFIPNAAMVALLAAVFAPGLSFGVIVVRPLYFLSFSNTDRWAISTAKVIGIHTVAGIVLPTVAQQFFDDVSPADSFAGLIFLGAAFGFMLGTSCSPTPLQRDFWVVLASSASIAIATVVILVAGANSATLMTHVPRELRPVYSMALCFVTIHALAAAGLSVRSWRFGPALDEPPPLDNPATLPP